MKFPAVIAAMRAGGRITAERLHYFDFASGPIRVWEGMGKLITPSTGEDWDGTGKIIRIEGGGQASGLFSANMKLTVAFDRDSSADPIIKSVLHTQSEIYGRRYFCAIQFFNENLKPIDSYRPYFVGVMDRVTYSATATAKEITLNVEPPLVRKNNARVTYFSDRDHKRRAADDDFLSRISRLQTKTIQWPKY
jgi:hypothetical protein